MLTHFTGRLYSSTGALLSRLYFGAVRPLQDRARDRAFRYLRDSQWWSTDRLHAEQWKGVQSLLRHAYDNVPYYRALFQSLSASPEDFRAPQDLERLPLLTKDIIQSEGSRLRATAGFPAHGVYLNHTGGSVGMPLSFWQDANYRAWGMAEVDRNFWMCGYRPGQRQAYLWGSDVDSKAHKGLLGKLHDLTLNRRWIDTFDLDSSKLRGALADLVAFRPHLMVGYVSSLMLLARLIESEDLPAPRPHAIQTSAEVLTTAARDSIERTLRARCFDRYGCREVGNIAHECEAHSGLHVLMENNYAEFLANDGTAASPGTLGRIVVTNLRNYVTTFIRYAIDDLGVPSERKCACGRGLALMESVQGRMSEVIVTSSGRLLHGEFFTHLFYGLAGIRQFQVEQVTRSKLVIRMVAESDRAYSAAGVHLEGTIRRYGDQAFEIEFVRLTHIPPRKSGKYCFTLSRVPLVFEKRTPDAMAR